MNHYAPSAEDIVATLSTYRDIWQGLTDREKNFFVMRYYDDKKFAEIANALGVSIPRVRTINLHMLRKIKKMLIFDYSKDEDEYLKQEIPIDQFDLYKLGQNPFFRRW